MALDLQARSMAAQVQANLDEYIETFQNGMKFVGVSSTDPLVSGATVSGYSDWAAGNIVLYSDKEYLLTATPNIAANWAKFGEDSEDPNPFSVGAGHDSAILVATPNPEDPSVDRTNVASGNFSAVLAGSRNSVTGSEASSVGGRNTVSGNDAFAAGYHGTSSGENSFTAGYNNTASGGSSAGFGFQTEASGEASFAGGRKTEASGDYSSAFGRATTAIGENAFSEGKFTLASGEAAHVEGLGVASNDRSEASGKASHAEGWYTKAVGVASHTEGTDTVANGDYSHAEGDTTHTNGLGQHSEGVGTIATSASGNNGQHVAGRYNVETAGARVTGGGVRSSERANIEVLDWSGNLTIAGKMTVGAAPTNNMDVTTKQYVDGYVAQRVPYVRGTGHDSVILNATPNAADPSVDRTNTVTGDFSAVVAGSRNTISATESAAAGGIITISGGGNNLGTGYRQTMTDCENSMSNGYRNTLDSCAQVKALGRGLNLTYCSNGIFAGYDITCTGTGAEKCEGNALFGRDVSSTASYGLSAGLHIHISNSCAAAIGDNLLTSKYGQTNVGMWNKANNQAYFVVGSGQSEAARKNCFAAGWDGNGTTEDERKVIWIGDTKVSEKQIKQLISGTVTLSGNNTFTGQNTFTNTTVCNSLQDGNGNAYVTAADVTEVVANPTVSGSEATLTSLQVGNTKYRVPSGGGGGSGSQMRFLMEMHLSEFEGGFTDKYYIHLGVTQTALNALNLLDGFYILWVQPGIHAIEETLYGQSSEESEFAGDNQHSIQFQVENGEVIFSSGESTEWAIGSNPSCICPFGTKSILFYNDGDSSIPTTPEYMSLVDVSIESYFSNEQWD